MRFPIMHKTNPRREAGALVAGYVMVKAESLQDAARWATRYIDAVEADEVDLREVEE